MSIFKNTTETNFTAPVFEGYEVENYGDIIALEESYDDLLAIIESVHEIDSEEIEYTKKVAEIEEDADLNEDEKEDLLEEAATKFESVTENAIEDFFKRVQIFLNNLWGKIKAFLQSAVRYFMAIVKSGKDFATQYEKELGKLNLSGFKYTMYEYTNLDGAAGSSFLTIAQEILDKEINTSVTTQEAAEEMIKKVQENRQDIMAKVRGAYLGKGTIKKEEYGKELFKYFRKGADSKEEVAVNIKTVIDTLKNGNELKSIENAKKDCDKAFSKYLKNVKDLEKKARANEKTEKELKTKLVSLTQKYASMISEAKSYSMEFFRAWRRAVNERNNTYKSVCLAAFRYKADK